MTKREPPRRTTDLPNLFRVSRIHNYYQSNKNCTQKQAITFLGESKYMVGKYSLLLSECRAVIAEVLGVDKSQCFGNFNKELKSCCLCGGAVECYHASDLDEVLPQGLSG